MRKKLGVRATKGSFFRSGILDKCMDGDIQLVHDSTPEEGESKVETNVYIVNDKTNAFSLKVISCKQGDAEAVEHAKEEYKLSLTCSKLSTGIAAPIDIQIYEDVSTNEVSVEMLFEYGGANLHERIGKVTAKELVKIANKTLDPLKVMEEHGIFHSDLKPSNMVCKDNKIKIIDFGVSKEFGSRSKLLAATTNISSKIKGYTFNYCPPEVFRSAKSSIYNKFDVYCWAMTMYQLITGKDDRILIDEVNDFKAEGKNYAEFIKMVKSIKLADDADNKFSVWVIPTLVQALDLDPKSRPSFSELKTLFGNKHIICQKELAACIKERDLACEKCTNLTKELEIARLAKKELLQQHEYDTNEHRKEYSKLNLLYQERTVELAEYKRKYESTIILFQSSQKDLEEHKKAIERLRQEKENIASDHKKAIAERLEAISTHANAIKELGELKITIEKLAIEKDNIVHTHKKEIENKNMAYDSLYARYNITAKKLEFYLKIKEKLEGNSSFSCYLTSSYDPLKCMSSFKAKEEMFEKEMFNARKISHYPIIVEEMKWQELNQAFNNKASNVDDLFRELSKKTSSDQHRVVKNAFESLVSSRMNNIYLYDQQIGDAGAKLIAVGLQASKSVIQLRLGYNKLTNEGVRALGNALKGQKTLKLLSLGHYGYPSSWPIAFASHPNRNNIGIEGVKAIAEGLASNVVLEFLDLSYCGINSESVSLLYNAFEFNHTLLSLHLEGNPIQNKEKKKRDNLFIEYADFIHS